MEEIGENLKRIQQIDEIAKTTLNRHHQKMPQKYANIQATLKLLTNLINTFYKRAEQHQQELRHRAKIKDLEEQIHFHRERVQDCKKMSEALSSKVEKKRSIIAEQEVTVGQLRSQLLRLKTENVKKVILLQNLEAKQKNEMEKENTQMRKTTWKMKTQFSRAFHSICEQPQNELLLEKSRSVKSLYAALNKKKVANSFMGEAWQMLKSKLYQHERKANNNGLNGSLVFKMIQNEHPCPPKPLNYNKLIIYDVLKQKYRNHKRQERKDVFEIKEGEFMKMSLIQIFGLIELRGGITKLQQAISSFQRRNSQKNIPF